MITSRIACTAWLLAVCVLAGWPAWSAEIHSNGLGGGDWSDPLSWREKAVPTENDDAVVSRGDVIAFDRNDEGRTTCQQIFIDPNGSLVFKTGQGKLVCCVAGAIETFGGILLDGSKSASDQLELRLTGADAARRTIKLMKGGKLTLNGRRTLPHGKHNVLLTAAHDALSKTPPIEATVDGRDGAGLDAQRAELLHVHLNLLDIDNIGAEVGERLNVAGNHFSGVARLTMTNCDSPTVADNLFELGGVVSTPNSAIYANVCQLAEIRDNVIRGRYSNCIQARAMVDSLVSGGEYEGGANGVYFYGTNGMLKNLTIRNCGNGLICTSMSGVVEDVRVENCAVGYYHALANAQVTNLQVDKVPKSGVLVSYYSGPLRLLNCQITPDQITPTKGAPQKAKDGTVPIEYLFYLVVRPTGKVPPGARVVVRTAGRQVGTDPQAARAADLNVRNSPSALRSNGLTPLPESLEPIVVRGWTFDDDIRPVPAPQYEISILPPAPASGTEPKPLATALVTPDAAWFRADPNAPQPTLEVNVP